MGLVQRVESCSAGSIHWWWVSPAGGAVFLDGGHFSEACWDNNTDTDICVIFLHILSYLLRIDIDIYIILHPLVDNWLSWLVYLGVQFQFEIGIVIFIIHYDMTIAVALMPKRGGGYHHGCTMYPVIISKVLVRRVEDHKPEDWIKFLVYLNLAQTCSNMFKHVQTSLRYTCTLPTGSGVPPTPRSSMDLAFA